MERSTKFLLVILCIIMTGIGGGFIGARFAINMLSEQAEKTQTINEDITNTSATNPTNNKVEETPITTENTATNDKTEETPTTTEDSANDKIEEPPFKWEDIAASVINPANDTMSLTELFLAANPAVVAISTETMGRNFFGQIVTLPASGSGFIVSDNGYIVTNDHVIGNANRISVLLYNGDSYQADIIGRDPRNDLAVLKIDTEDLIYLTFGDSDNLQVGEQVAAIGNPLGEFANSMTVGVVSALNRELNIDGTPLNMLQTDAAVNRGNSGGPLLNTKGEVIGVVTAKTGGSNVEGIGFAIPSNLVSDITTGLINTDPLPGRPVMGVTVATVNNATGQTAVRIEHIAPGSGAERGGLLVGDIILSVNDIIITNGNELISTIASMSPGDTITIKVLRDTEELTVSVVLGESTSL